MTSSREPVALYIDGPRTTVKVSGLRDKRDVHPSAFPASGPSGTTSEWEVVATLRPMPPNDWNLMPIEVWVNGVHVAWVHDEDSPRYWHALRDVLPDVISCAATVKGDRDSSDIARMTLALPERLSIFRGDR